MKEIIKGFTTLQSSAANIRRVCIATVCVSAVTVLVALAMSYGMVSSERDTVYVLDKGMASSATASDSDTQRELEVRDHVSRFHELMFNLAPSAEAIRSSIDRALLMSDRSAYNYWQDLSERGFYSRLVSANISQTFSLDSIRTDMGSYPYGTEVYGKLYLIRESNITLYDFHSTCRLVDVGRSTDNPHGLMIEQFRVVSNDKVETRKRN